LVKIVVFESGWWVTLNANWGNGGNPPTTVGIRKLESPGYHVIALFALSRFDTILACDRHTDRHTKNDG